jgi:K+-sensing histidine kinase KdpD
MERDTSVIEVAPAARRYGVAVLSVSAAFALTRALWPWVDPHPTPLFLAAVVLSAFYAGPGPSLLATALAALVVDYFFIPPTAGIELSVDSAVRTGVFVSAGLLISWSDAARRRAEGELRRQVMRQATVADLGQRALSGAELSALMETAVSAVARSLDAESVALWGFSPERESLAVRASVGWTAEFLRHAEVDAEADSMLTRALRSAEPVIVTDSDATTSAGEPPELRREARACVSLAVPGRGLPFGVLSVYTDRRQGFSAEDIHFIRSVANVLSYAAGRGAGEQTRAEALDGIVRNVELQKRLIEDLVDLSRVAAGRLRADARPADLAPVIEDASGRSRGPLVLLPGPDTPAA